MEVCTCTHGCGSQQNGDSTVVVREVSGVSHREFFLTAVPKNGESPRELFKKAAEAVRQLGAQMVSLEVFGINAEERPALAEAFGEISWPVTWLDEGCAPPAPLYGVQCSAVTGAATAPLRVDGALRGTVFEADGVRYCRLGGLTADKALSRADQTAGIFALMQAALKAAEMDFSHVVRTWFYNFEMLEWYGEFNQVRTAFFKEHGVFDGVVPASTGIGGHNGAGTALTAGLLAVKSLGGVASAVVAPSPLQCPAPNYGSSFSRAVELETQGARRLFVSGTASIDPDGNSVHIDDIDAQIALTMRVAHAILASRGMDWKDTARLIAYFKYRKDAPAFARYCAEHGLSDLPALYTANDICRDDLLFEIELDAAVQR